MQPSIELDIAVRSLLKLIDEYLALQLQAELLLKPGWMNLASARYNLGPGSLTSASYPAAMEALAVVDVRHACETSPSFSLRIREPDTSPIHRPALGPDSAVGPAPDSDQDEEDDNDEGAPRTRRSQEEDLQSLLQHLDLTNPAAASDEASKACPQRSGAPEAALQKGGGAATSKKAAEESELPRVPRAEAARPEEVGPSGGKSGGRRAAKFDPRSDPMHWFGYLVPPALKQAKASFAAAIPKLCEAAALRSRIAQAADEVAAIRGRLRGEAPEAAAEGGA